MEYMIVNDLHPAGLVCAVCDEPIVPGYVREIHTRAVFCTRGCYHYAAGNTILAVEYYMRSAQAGDSWR